MNPRLRQIIIAALGIFMLAASVALVSPAFIRSFLGYSLDPARAAYQLGELRAVYGGLFGVIGVSMLLAAMDPAAHRERLILLAWCWLGLGGGRLLGAFVDGNPGARGWAFIVSELAAGAAVLVCTPPATAPRPH